MGKPENVYGEGNYEASRKYNDAAKKFAQSGKVDKAAQDAAPSSDAEALQMAAAEAEGRSHARGEDPALTRKTPRKRAPAPGGVDTPATAPEDSRAPKPDGKE
jgi:hypothetical protein